MIIPNWLCFPSTDIPHSLLLLLGTAPRARHRGDGVGAVGATPLPWGRVSLGVSGWLYVGLAAGGASPFLFSSSWLLHALVLHVQEGDAARCAPTRPGDPGAVRS